VFKLRKLVTGFIASWLLIASVCAAQTANSIGVDSYFGIETASNSQSFKQSKLDSSYSNLTSLALDRESFREFVRSVPTRDVAPMPLRAIPPKNVNAYQGIAVAERESAKLRPLQLKALKPKPQLLQPIIVDSQVQLASLDTPAIDKDGTEEKSDSPEATATATETGDKSEPKQPASAIEEVTEDDLEKQIEAQKKLINENDSLDEPTKLAYQEQLNSASTWLQKAKTFRSSAEELQSKISDFDRDMATQKDELEKMNSVRQIDPESTSEELQTQLQAKRTELQEAKTRFATILSQIDEREARIAQLPARQNSAQDRLKTIEQSFASLANKPEDVTMQLSILALETQKLATKNEVDALKAEVQRQEQVGKLLPVERDVLSRNVNRLETEIAEWENEFNIRRAREIEAEQTKAKKMAREAIESNPAFAELANRNKQLLEIWEKLTKKLKDTREEKQKVEDRNQDINKNFDSLKKKIEQGMTTANGMLLVEHRKDLMQPMQSQVRIKEITKELQRVRNEKATLKDQREPLATTESFVADYAKRNNRPENDTSGFNEMVSKLAVTQLEYLDRLNGDYETYRGLLFAISNEHSALIKQIRESRDYIDENAMWIQSSQPTVLADFNKSKGGLSRFFDLTQWRQLAGTIKERIIGKPYESGIAAVLLMGVFIFNRRLGGQNA
jgi:DNA repair exonuclease SbcCD ATPase subunit